MMLDILVVDDSPVKLGKIQELIQPYESAGKMTVETCGSIGEAKRIMTDKQLKDLKDAVTNLRLGIENFKKGAPSQYKIVATQLRLLLLDKENTLLLKIDPKMEFPRIRLPSDDMPWMNKDNIVFSMPGVVSLEPNAFPEFSWD